MVIPIEVNKVDLAIRRMLAKSEERMMTQTVAQLVEASKALNADEKLQLFDALWDQHEPLEAEDFELAAEESSELDRRREELRQSPDTAVSFEEGQKFLAEIRASRRTTRSATLRTNSRI